MVCVRENKFLFATFLTFVYFSYFSFGFLASKVSTMANVLTEKLRNGTCVNVQKKQYTIFYSVEVQCAIARL